MVGVGSEEFRMSRGISWLRSVLCDDRSKLDTGWSNRPEVRARLTAALLVLIMKGFCESEEAGEVIELKEIYTL